MYDGGLKRFGFGVNHHGGIKTRSHFGRGFILIGIIGFWLVYRLRKTRSHFGRGFYARGQTPRLVRTDVRIIGQELVGLFGHVSCCSSCRIGWSACHVRAIPVAVFHRVKDDQRGGHLAGLARGFHVHAVQGFVGFLAGVNVVDDGLGEMRAPCGDVREFGEASALDGPVGCDLWIIPPVLHADVSQMVGEDVMTPEKAFARENICKIYALTDEQYAFLYGEEKTPRAPNRGA